MGDVRIRCKKCGQGFTASANANKLFTVRRVDRFWRCPECQTKNPNLVRHYRGFFTLGLIVLIMNAISLPFSGIPDEFLSAGVSIIGVLAACVLVVFFFRKPWESLLAKLIVWATVLVFLRGVLAVLVAGRGPIFRSQVSIEVIIAVKLLFFGLFVLYASYAVWVTQTAPDKYLIEEL